MSILGAPSSTIMVRQGTIKVMPSLVDGVTLMIGDDFFVELPRGGLERLEFAINAYRARQKLMSDAIDSAAQSTPAPGRTE